MLTKLKKLIFSLFNKKSRQNSFYSLTTDSSIRTNKDYSIPDIKNKAIFYRVRNDIGFFEIVKIEQINNIYIYHVYCNENGNTFKISKYWFDVLFEELFFSHKEM